MSFSQDSMIHRLSEDFPATFLTLDYEAVHKGFGCIFPLLLTLQTHWPSFCSTNNWSLDWLWDFLLAVFSARNVAPIAQHMPFSGYSNFRLNVTFLERAVQPEAALSEHGKAIPEQFTRANGTIKSLSNLIDQRMQNIHCPQGPWQVT